MPACLHFFLLFALSLVLTACDVPVASSPLSKRGCQRCHKVHIDKAHNLSCQRCHLGNPSANRLPQAHERLVSHPAHPDNMARFCGPCHERMVEKAKRSVHFTLEGEIGAVWSRFFPQDSPPSIKELSSIGQADTERGIIADLLRRRCLRCHVYYQGDQYQGVKRGLGCAACHMRFVENGSWDHRFYREVPDNRCLSCHYGNTVGWDYYGRFEKDYDQDYRAPLVKGRHLKRPYGVEWHEMTPDLHQKNGMSCVTCHTKGPCQGQDGTLDCIDCHGPAQKVPMNMDRIGHRPQDQRLVSCATCHATWVFMDRGIFLTRQDDPDLLFWEYLAVQGSSEVESVVSSAANGYMDIRVGMTDKITGQFVKGLWFKGFYQRRWGPVILGESQKGRLEVLRPVCELYVSYVDSDGEVIINNLMPQDMNKNPLVGWAPYMPHTIGRADSYRCQKVSNWLSRHMDNNSSQ